MCVCGGVCVCCYRCVNDIHCNKNRRVVSTPLLSEPQCIKPEEKGREKEKGKCSSKGLRPKLAYQRENEKEREREREREIEKEWEMRREEKRGERRSEQQGLATQVGPRASIFLFCSLFSILYSLFSILYFVFCVFCILDSYLLFIIRHAQAINSHFDTFDDPQDGYFDKRVRGGWVGLSIIFEMKHASNKLLWMCSIGKFVLL